LTEGRKKRGWRKCRPHVHATGKNFIHLRKGREKGLPHRRKKEKNHDLDCEDEEPLNAHRGGRLAVFEKKDVTVDKNKKSHGMEKKERPYRLVIEVEGLEVQRKAACPTN